MTGIKLLTMTLLTGAALGGVGYGLAGGTGEGPAPAAPPDNKTAEAPKPPEAPAQKPAEPKPADTPATPPVAPPPGKPELAYDAKSIRLRTATAEANTRTTLQKPASAVFGYTLEGLSHDAMFGLLTNFGVYVRFDYPAFARNKSSFGIPADAPPFGFDEVKLGEMKLKHTPQPGQTLGEYLQTICVSIHPVLTYRIRGDQVLITAPAYQPGAYVYQIELDLGPPVSVAFENADLYDAATTLRQLTGANIVVSSPEPKPNAAPRYFNATFDDVRLRTVLELLALQNNLEVVYFQNVFYLAPTEAAATMRQRAKAISHSVSGSTDSLSAPMR